MPRKNAIQTAAELRRRAEEALAKRRPAAPMSEAETLRALHELQVHQLELEMQHESLQESEAEAQDALRMLAELNESMEQRIGQRTAELVIAREAAEAANRAKSVFLSNINHELRTPLNGMVGMVELALRRATDEKQADWLRKSLKSADVLLAVINDILDLSQMDAETLRAEPVEFTLGSVLERVTDMLSSEASKKKLAFEVEIPADLASRPLLGDRQRLARVLVNMVGNAVKFTDRGAVHLCVSVKREAPEEVLAHFMVKDTGIGISAEEQGRLFQAFHQVDASMSRSQGGAGLGLAICSRMVGLMGGHIGVESALGTGSTFWFTAPLGVAARAVP